jgi:stage V sporulation protein G
VEITEVRIKLMEDNSGSNERLQAFCSITFDDMFVIRDLKIIEGAKGFFVAMPSRKLTDRCPNCGTKNHLRSRFCNQCGCRLDENRAIRDADGRAKLHADIAHPINSGCREKIQTAVLASYADELERSKLPGYVSRYDDLDGEYEQPFETAAQSGAPGAPGSHEPPLRRGPLRSHTQHNRAHPSVLRGPHVLPRQERDGSADETKPSSGRFGRSRTARIGHHKPSKAAACPARAAALLFVGELRTLGR